MSATLWQVFERSVERFGNHVAVEVQRRDRVDRFTYRDIHHMAQGAAAWLAGRGIAAGDRCSILADNGADWCGAYLGILAVGAIAVPLDTNYSAAQVATIVGDSGARILLANDRLMRVAEEAMSKAGAACELAPLASAFARGISGELRRDLAEAAFGREGGPEAPAVILYTSGTTSDPKGVVLTHANLLAERDAAFTVVDVTEHDAILGVLPLFHSLAQLANLLLPFAVGARVVYLESVNSTELVRGLAERQITLFCCVPQFFYLIHQRVTGEVQKAGWLAAFVFGALKGACFHLRRVGLNLGPVVFSRMHRALGGRIRLFVTGGSRFDPAVGRDLYAMGFTIVQAYGLTETSGAATISAPSDAYVDTVGRPLHGVDVKIVDPSTLSGQSGEIAIRGPIVMQGYFNRPDATEAVMKDGWFLTGDLGRVDARGRVIITGRKKEIIVLASGKNIHPEEIEAHYRQSAYVKEICVLGIESPEHRTAERLHAVVVPNAELMRERKMVNAGDIIRFEMEGLAASLPAHKRVLGYDVWFEPLPRTTTGKVKRHEVERLLKARRAAAPEGGAPLSPGDQAWIDEPHAAAAAAVIKARLKGPARVAPDANLELILGLDSMERVELLTELEHRFGVTVSKESAHEIFTVRQLVEAVRPGPRTTRMTQRAGGIDESWAVLLRDLPADTDPVLGGLLERKWFWMPVLFVVSRLLGLVLGRVRVRGLEALPGSGAFIISPNHQSYLDPFVVCSVLPFRVFKQLFFVGAVEYFETPLTRWAARTVNCVPVDPDSNLVPAMQAGAFGLARGKVLMLFPEGERSIDGTVKKFKKGSPILARHLGVPIVPVALKGVYELWPRTRPLNWRLLGPWSRHRITVSVGEPMRFGEDESYADAAGRLRERVDEMWQKA